MNLQYCHHILVIAKLRLKLRLSAYILGFLPILPTLACFAGLSRTISTGVPPHVAILGKMKALFDAILKPMEHDDATRIATVKDIMGELEKRAIGAGTVTFDGLDAALKRCLDSAGVTELINKLGSLSSSSS
ncbi:hypothetical protein PPTG_16628 [Phytophthora nicotianae INRA-310]|uniref:Uncharacterized protein n=1 Tax=Phytophthora nicotianae (strain INRA-310) TaxID=761204 RepID=W2PP72_PHYN3|nr:hypothetical protein PPTG_16628 [Phytophthora nicotianae INRA-310]ETN02426.1 hypothetical protein PPTG_16628 [Phytophthora nicotianae INRA-310]